MALIRSPAAGMKRASKAMEEDVEEQETMEEEEITELDTSIKMSKKKKSKASRARIVEEIHEDDQQMLEA